VVLTQDGAWRRGARVPLKAQVDKALVDVPSVQHVVVLQRMAEPRGSGPEREHDWRTLVAGEAPTHEAPALDAEHPLFILYTSGTTGKPKGVLHTTGGYMVGAGAHHQVRLRPARRRRVLVHRRRGLGHRPQLRRVRAALATARR
jgi:acetyl-CoA synthetase